MNLPESEMSAPVMAWLDGRGYVPYAEVDDCGYWVDIVGMRAHDEELVAIEMKTSLTQLVIRQAYRTRRFADYSYCAVIAKPRPPSLLTCTGRGIGVLWVQDGRVSILIEAKKQIMPVKPGRQLIITRLRLRPPGGIAGKPTLKGEGPAQDCARRVKQWRLEHPGCTWGEIYANVGNHYANMASMRGALTSRGLV